MKNFASGFLCFFKACAELPRLVLTAIHQFPAFCRGLAKACRCCFRRPARDGCCIDLTGILKRPDPMIYSQYWLMKQGLSVTWDNPDIQLFETDGIAVDPSKLQRAHDYEVVVRCWNNSYDAGVPVLPVHLSYLTFGIGTTTTPVPPPRTTTLGVKASPTCPAFVKFLWRTPEVAGHYCLQAHLACSDDANPENNVGQKNVLVGQMHSPARFTFPVHNDATVPRILELEADMYRLPDLPLCDQERVPPQPENPRERRPREGGRFAESRARWDKALREQGYRNFPVTSDWRVTIRPERLELRPDEAREVEVEIESTNAQFRGTQAFNIHGFATPAGGPRVLAGGVTLLVENA